MYVYNKNESILLFTALRNIVHKTETSDAIP